MSQPCVGCTQVWKRMNSENAHWISDNVHPVAVGLPGKSAEAARKGPSPNGEPINPTALAPNSGSAVAVCIGSTNSVHAYCRFAIMIIAMSDATSWNHRLWITIANLQYAWTLFVEPIQTA